MGREGFVFLAVSLPTAFLQSLDGLPGFNKEAFLQIHADAGSLTSIRINPLKCSIAPDSLPLAEKVPWSSFGYYLEKRPSFTFDPFFHAGTYYVQEASSMFLEQAMRQSLDLSKPLRVLDISAAPGGKSTHLQSLLSPDSLLVSNEVIRSRSHILYENCMKWGGANVVVTNNDPRDFSRLEGWFDVIVVDAPCSGSGLFRRDPEAIGEWSEEAVTLCSQRQQRILTDILPALKKEGVLIYSTCSYSREEDEAILDWMVQDGGLETISLQLEKEWGIVETESTAGAKGYRFWPDQVKGEGFFIGCFRKPQGEEEPAYSKEKKISPLSRKELADISPWVKQEGLFFWKHEQFIQAIQEESQQVIGAIFHALRVVNAGFRVGEWMRDKLIPDHALAMTVSVQSEIPRLNLDKEQAIRYLQRKEITGGAIRGWQLAHFSGHNLGWVNVLPNRVNNYYPKELRILKEDGANG